MASKFGCTEVDVSPAKFGKTSDRRRGTLILRLADNESNWGYTSLRYRPRNLGYRVSRSTIADVLREHGVAPAPTRRRRMSWSTFMKAHWPTLAAMDFTTVEVWTNDTEGGVRWRDAIS